VRIRFHAILGITAVLVATALTAGYFLVHSGAGNGRGGRLTPDRICPVRSCADYPEPDQVKGITLATLTNYIVFSKAARAQIRAAHAWRANAVRIQVVQDKLVGQAGRKLSPGYLADVRRLVDYALRRHLTVILNATTELSTGFPADENLPTRATYSFWRYLAHYYGHNPHVVFDLFNEPRFCDWAQWQAAFQPLVDYLRGIGARNQFWVEGIRWGSTLAGVSRLHGQGIVYSFHHPGSPWPWQAPVGPATWDQAFGYLTREHLPVVDGEFVNFLGGYYWPRSTQMVSEYLRYLAAHHIGLVGWTLQAGIMTATSELASAVSEPQGAGRLIWRYFHGQPLPPAPDRTERVPVSFGRIHG
jgi:cellulase (glycosyl hydrolase family 5)